MASIKLSRNDIETLEVKANLAYETFRRAFFTRDDTERAALFSSAACLYAYDLEDYLSSLTQRNTENIRCLGKGGKRAKPIERYILQCVLMHPVHLTDTIKYEMEINDDPEDGLGGLRNYINSVDTPNKAELFRMIQDKSAILRKQGAVGFILLALDYVREKFPKPEL